MFHVFSCRAPGVRFTPTVCPNASFPCHRTFTGPVRGNEALCLRSFRPVVAPCLNKKTNLRLTVEIKPMKMKSKLALSLGLLAAPLALMAWSPEKAYVESYRSRADTPVPISVIMPDVSAKFAGLQVVLEFVVDSAGKPTLITSVTPGADAELVAAVTAAVSNWKFAPALVDGKPVARKVALPVNIVSLDSGARFASK